MTCLVRAPTRADGCQRVAIVTDDATELTFVGRLEVTESAHVLLVLEVNTVQVEGEVAFGEGLKVTQAAGDHGGTSIHAGVGVSW